ncbi:MAG: hypothetical protein GEV06_23545 [Luteitalea sp.]|nr:hypothetical protein [Luteitalea sp.]
MVRSNRYRGIDGTALPFCDEVVDLVQYRSTVPGIFMRHLLEHNDDWARVLDNALASLTERMVLDLSSPVPRSQGIEFPPGSRGR